MKPMTLEQVAAAVGGWLNRPDDQKLVVTGICTDSRKDPRGSLFVPFRGAHFDGHDFIADILGRGGVAALCERDGFRCEGPVIQVEDTKKALMALAAFYRSQFPIPLVAVTGSVGKTTTKDMIAAVLSQKYRVLKTEGNYNNEIGLPLTLFRMDEQTQAAVIEMGMSNFGEIHALADIARPGIAVITNIGMSHVENLGSQEGILRAKCEILDFLPADGYAVLNGDDPLLAGLAQTHVRAKDFIYYGTENDNRLTVHDVEYKGIASVCFTLAERGGESVSITLSYPGRHMIQNALCAATIGRLLGISLADVKRGLEGFRLTGMRLDITKSVQDVTIINDTYNASPDSMKAALQVLGRAEGRRIAVLGDMLELGRFSEALHREVGEYAAQTGIDALFTCGALGRYIREGALLEAKDCGISLHFTDKPVLIALLKGYIKPGDTVLVKASRGMRFEEIVAAIQ